jgi:hypothetical protein
MRLNLLGSAFVNPAIASERHDVVWAVRSATSLATLVCGQTDQAFATHLVSPDFKAPAISKPHFLVSRTASVRLVRLAHQEPGASGFGAFAFVVHVEPIAFRTPRFSWTDTDTMDNGLRRFP